MKLPKLSFPTFIGEYLKLNAFLQAFEISADLKKIPNSHKLAYLNSLLLGYAAHALNGISMSDAGFTDVCSILNERFGDPKQLSFKNLQELLKLNIPKVFNSRDTECLWDFYNSVQPHVRRCCRVWHNHHIHYAQLSALSIGIGMGGPEQGQGRGCATFIDHPIRFCSNPSMSVFLHLLRRPQASHLVSLLYKSDYQQPVP